MFLLPLRPCKCKLLTRNTSPAAPAQTVPDKAVDRFMQLRVGIHINGNKIRTVGKRQRITDHRRTVFPEKRTVIRITAEIGQFLRRTYIAVMFQHESRKRRQKRVWLFRRPPLVLNRFEPEAVHNLHPFSRTVNTENLIQTNRIIQRELQTVPQTGGNRFRQSAIPSGCIDRYSAERPSCGNMVQRTGTAVNHKAGYKFTVPDGTQLFRIPAEHHKDRTCFLPVFAEQQNPRLRQSPVGGTAIYVPVFPEIHDPHTVFQRNSGILRCLVLQREPDGILTEPVQNERAQQRKFQFTGRGAVLHAVPLSGPAHGFYNDFPCLPFFLRPADIRTAVEAGIIPQIRHIHRETVHSVVPEQIFRDRISAAGTPVFRNIAPGFSDPHAIHKRFIDVINSAVHFKQDLFAAPGRGKPEFRGILHCSKPAPDLGRIGIFRRRTGKPHVSIQNPVPPRRQGNPVVLTV